MSPKAILAGCVMVGAILVFAVMAVIETILRGRSVLSDCGLDHESE
jgi:hypothetical protein